MLTLKIIEGPDRGKRFDPDCVEAFFKQLDRTLLRGSGPLPDPITG